MSDEYVSYRLGVEGRQRPEGNLLWKSQYLSLSNNYYDYLGRAVREFIITDHGEPLDPTELEAMTRAAVIAIGKNNMAEARVYDLRRYAPYDQDRLQEDLDAGRFTSDIREKIAEGKAKLAIALDEARQADQSLAVFGLDRDHFMGQWRGKFECKPTVVDGYERQLILRS